MTIAYEHHDAEVDAELVDKVARLFEASFDRPPEPDFAARMQAKRRLHVVLATQNGETLGFKMGYERFHGVFFSWLGGVTPSHRRAGIAKRLLREQHRWCLRCDFSEVQTETFGDGRAMLILNLKQGFEVYGTYLGNDQKIRVQLRKLLT